MPSEDLDLAKNFVDAELAGQQMLNAAVLIAIFTANVRPMWACHRSSQGERQASAL